MTRFDGGRLRVHERRG